MHFLRPIWLLALIPMLYLCWRLSLKNLIDNWRTQCDPHLLPHLLVTPKHTRKVPLILLAIGCCVAIFSLAGPSWHQETQPVYRSTHGTVIVLNLSPSMSDVMGTTTKIDRARFKLLDYLQQRRDGLTGLVVYTDESHVVSPLTEDNHTIANFVPSLDPSIMPTYNDDTVVGLREAEKLLKQSNINRGTVLLVTDKITNLADTKAVAKSLLQQGYQLNILKITTPSETDKTMEKVALAGGGRVIDLSPNNNDVNTMLASSKLKSWINTTKKTEEKGMFWHDDGRYLVFLLLPLALIAFRRGYF
jgi:Ca-activated chloride channel homolog